MNFDILALETRDKQRIPWISVIFLPLMINNREKGIVKENSFLSIKFYVE